MNAIVRAALLTIAVCAAATGCMRTATSSRGGNSWTHHGLLRIVNLSDPDTLNPVIGNEQVDTDLAQLWAGTLFNYDDRNRLVPELATQEPTLANGGISRDGLRLTYHLRPGVLWQDGAPFTAADVIFTWHAVLNKRNNIPSTLGYDDVRAIDAPDPHTIVVHLKTPYAPFVATFFAPSGETYPVLPAHLLARYPDINRVAYNSQPVGTGPFIVDRWQRGSRIVFRANPHYWRGAPKLKEVWYTPVGDENTIATLLASHDADLEYRGASNNFAQLRHIDGFRTNLVPFNEYGQLALNTRSATLSDVRVRRALRYAFDSAAAIREVSHDVNVPATEDQPAFSPVYDPNVRRYPFDPVRARALLDEAGWKVGQDGVRTKGGQRLSIVIAGVTGSANGNALNVIVQRDWRNIGVDAEVKTYESSLYFASFGAGGILQKDRFDVAFFAWIGGVDPDDSTLFACNQIPPAGQNVYLFCDAQTDAAERRAVTSNDPAVRKAAYATIQARLADQVPLIIPWFVRRVSVENTDLQNYRPAHAVTEWWNAYDWQI